MHHPLVFFQGCFSRRPQHQHPQPALQQPRQFFPLELGEPLLFFFQLRLYLDQFWWYRRVFTLPLGQPLLGLMAIQVLGFTMILKIFSFFRKQINGNYRYDDD